MQTSRESRDALLDRVARKAGDYEEASVNCAQGTLLALVEEFLGSARRNWQHRCLNVPPVRAGLWRPRAAQQLRPTGPVPSWWR